LKVEEGGGKWKVLNDLDRIEKQLADTQTEINESTKILESGDKDESSNEPGSSSESSNQ